MLHSLPRARETAQDCGRSDCPEWAINLILGKSLRFVIKLQLLKKTMLNAPQGRVVPVLVIPKGIETTEDQRMPKTTKIYDCRTEVSLLGRTELVKQPDGNGRFQLSPLRPVQHYKLIAPTCHPVLLDVATPIRGVGCNQDPCDISPLVEEQCQNEQPLFAGPAADNNEGGNTEDERPPYARVNGGYHEKKRGDKNYGRATIICSGLWRRGSLFAHGQYFPLYASF